MNSQLLFRAILVVVLLLLAAGPGLARGAQPAGPAEAAGASAKPAAAGEWVIEVVDGTAGVGSHVTLGILQKAW